MFEGLVADILNKFLGDYVENLNSSQLNLGIWSGNVELENLIIKSTALAALNLPIKVRHGRIGKLTLQIPWKNLYGSPTIAIIDEINLVAVPNSGYEYDSVMEAEQRVLKKLQEVEQIELDWEIERKKNVVTNGSSGDSSSFSEKLAANVIKNLEVQIKNIHFRYDDRNSNVFKPFSAGFILDTFSLKSTSKQWKSSVLKQDYHVQKELSLESLSLYFNTDMSSKSKSPDPRANRYVVEPISLDAKLFLNQKDGDYSTPKLVLNFVFNSISIIATKDQYQRILDTVDTFNRLSINQKYRKWKPPFETKVQGNASAWWKYAINAVLEVDVKPKLYQRSWVYIHKKLLLIKDYEVLYFDEINGKLNSTKQKRLNQCISDLPVITLTQIRRKVNLEALELQSKKPNNSWYSNMFGRTNNAPNIKLNSNVIGQQMFNAMTVDEKQQLYAGIGYSESVSSTRSGMPQFYTKYKMYVELNELQITLTDENNKFSSYNQILKVQLHGVLASLGQQPANNGFKVSVKVDKFSVFGTPTNQCIPCLISTLTTARDDAILFIDYETNPSDQKYKCDQRLCVSAQPLEIIYDFQTLNCISEFFKQPVNAQYQLSAADIVQELAEQTTVSIKLMLESHSHMDIVVNLKASHLFVPYRGIFETNTPLIVVVIGSLKVRTDTTPNVSKAVGNSVQNIAEKYMFWLQEFQVIYSPNSTAWVDSLNNPDSDYQVIRPVQVFVTVLRSITSNDSNPSFRVKCDLPLISISLSDRRLFELISHVNSIPLAKSDNETLNISNLESDETTNTNTLGRNITFFVLTFNIKEFILLFSQKRNKKDVPILRIAIVNFGSTITQNSFDTLITSYLYQLSVQYLKYSSLDSGPIINLVNTPVSGEKKRFVALKCLMANKNGPEFSSKFQDTETLLVLNISDLEFMFHQEAFLNLVRILSDSIPKSFNNEPRATVVSKCISNLDISMKSDIIIECQVKAIFDSLLLVICTEKFVVVSLRLGEFSYGSIQYPSKKITSGRLNFLQMYDPTPKAYYSKIVYLVDSSEVMTFKLQSTIYPDNCQVSIDDTPDYIVEATIGRSRIVFLYKIWNRIMSFLDHVDIAKLQVIIASDIKSDSNITTTRAYRMRLNITFSEPSIIIPRHSSSTKGFVANLNSLRFFNQFKIVNETASEMFPAVLDMLDIKFNDITMSRVVMKSQKIMSQIMILEPITIEMVFTQNLSIEWFKKFPSIVFRMKMKECTFHLSHGDYFLMMATIGENFIEDASIRAESLKKWTEVSKEAVAYRSKRSSRTSIDDRVGGMSLQSLIQKYKPSHLYPYMVVDIFLHRVKIFVYIGDSEMEQRFNSRPPLSSLGLMELQNVAVIGEQYDDNSMRYDTSILNMTVHDTRPTPENKFFSLILTRSDSVLANNPNSHSQLLECVYMADKDGNVTSINKVKDLVITLNMEFLNQIYAVFMLPIDFYENPVYVQPSTKKQINISEIDISVPTIADGAGTLNMESPESWTDSEAAPDIATYNMTIEWFIDNPAIIMLQHPDDLNTPCLLWTFNGYHRQRYGESTVVYASSFDDMSITYCALANDGLLRENSMADSYELNGITFHCLESIVDIRSVRKDLLSGLRLSLVSSSSETTCDHHYLREQVLDRSLYNLFNPISQAIGTHIDFRVNQIVTTISPLLIRCITEIAMQATNTTELTPETKEFVPISDEIWEPKLMSGTQFWYLEAKNENIKSFKHRISRKTEKVVRQIEDLIVNIPKIVIRLEAGVGHKTVPMLVIEGQISAEIRDWSNLMAYGIDLSIEIAYFNERLAVWEPLVEPVENKNGLHRSYNLNVQMQTNDTTKRRESDEDAVDISFSQALSSVLLLSEDTLEITLTRTSLDVLTNLGKIFSDAYMLRDSFISSDTEDPHSFILHNFCEFEITINVDSLVDITSTTNSISLKPYEKYTLSSAKFLKKSDLSRSSLFGNTHIKKITMTIRKFYISRELHIHRSEKRVFELFHQDNALNDPWKLVVSTKTHEGRKTVEFTSVVELINLLPVQICVYYQTKKKEIVLAHTIDVDASIHLTLSAAHSRLHDLYFKPNSIIYRKSAAHIWTHSETNTVTCRSLSEYEQNFIFSVSTHIDIIPCGDGTSNQTSRYYTLRLKPTVVLHNLLPYDIKYSNDNGFKKDLLSAGRFESLINTDPRKMSLNIDILDYLDKTWSATISLYFIIKEEISKLKFISNVSKDKSFLQLAFQSVDLDGSWEIKLFSEYWMINKTELSLQYKLAENNNVYHHSNKMTNALLCNFPLKSKKRAFLKVNGSEWSDKFTLDAVGSSGHVSALLGGKIYNIGISISISGSGLTKIVTFTPYYIAFNRAPYSVLVRDDSSNSSWLLIGSESCVPFWPNQSIKSKEQSSMRVKIKGTEIITCAFSYTVPHSTLLRLKQPYGGIVVECQPSAAATIINIEPFDQADAAGLIVNNSNKVSIFFVQTGCDRIQSLAPQESVLYSWENPLIKHELVWGLDYSILEANRMTRCRRTA